MTTKCIAFTRPDGGVSVITPVPGDRYVVGFRLSGTRFEFRLSESAQSLYELALVASDYLAEADDPRADMMLALAAHLAVVSDVRPMLGPVERVLHRYAEIPDDFDLLLESEEEWLARVLARNIEVGQLREDTPILLVDESELPSRRFRDDWRISGRTLAPGLSLVRARCKAEVRAERNARLLASDADHVRLSEVGTTLQRQSMANYRRALRDLPATTDAQIDARTVEQLESWEPTWPTKPNV